MPASRPIKRPSSLQPLVVPYLHAAEYTHVSCSQDDRDAHELCSGEDKRPQRHHPVGRVLPGWDQDCVGIARQDDQSLQTLIVWSSDPDTILVPSGENATDLMKPLWAFVFSLSISSLSARQANRRQFWPRRGDLRAQRTRIPDFDRPVVRSGHNLGPVRGKRHRPDIVVVGVGLLAQQLQFVCQTSQQALDLAEEGRF
jgi:hypothetical protein